MNRRTVVVDGPLAYRMRRFAAARDFEHGLQILTLPLLAARLAGGFYRPALAEDLEPAITDALGEGGFAEIEFMRSLPGTTRAAGRTLADLWSADLSLADLAARSPRLSDLALLEQRLLNALPRGALAPRPLRDLALRAARHAPAVLGPVELAPSLNVARVWQPLLRALNDAVPLSWHEPATPDLGWFPGNVLTQREAVAAAPSPVAVSCADPPAEVVEALRWARELIASGTARPEEIAICATSLNTWDDHFVSLAESSTLPLHFSSGIPALATREGQACASLATVLLHGLSQERIRRLIAHVASQSKALAALPTDWARGLPGEATLFHLEEWRRALDAAAIGTDGAERDPRPVLWPVLELLSKRTEAAARAGDTLLGQAGRTLWRRALRASPPHALEFSLRAMRVTDDRDPAVSVVWCPASHLVGAPRRWVRLLGLNSKTWPRTTLEDPLLPAHVLNRAVLDPDPITQRDRRAFQYIVTHASAGTVLSHSRRDRQGRLLPASPLIELNYSIRALARGRRPQHAFSETDRLLARPAEAAATPRVASALACWGDWHRREVTPHDGRIPAAHPLILKALTRVQSATSLRLMLRDPLLFVWQYALGWRSTVQPEEPLTLNPRIFGELVHEILRRTVDQVEPAQGFARAAPEEIDHALDVALSEMRQRWPLERSLPPTLLWEHVLLEGQRLARSALRSDRNLLEGTRCWTEVAFGQPAPRPEDAPWDITRPVAIPNTSVRIRGSIDRLDLSFDRQRVRVSDYKTGDEPPDARSMVIAGGTEVQRVIYAIAVRELLPEVPQIQARLLYLKSDPPRKHALENIDRVIGTLSRYVKAAYDLLESDQGLLRPERRERSDEFLLALPADVENYRRIKRGAFERAFGDFARLWDLP